MAEPGSVRPRVLRADMYDIQLRYMRVAAECQVFFKFTTARSTGKLPSSSLRRSASARL
jgi:hypothetical protein